MTGGEFCYGDWRVWFPFMLEHQYCLLLTHKKPISPSERNLEGIEGIEGID